jgi:DNA-directed RNA polymerase subunit RPC12/RpoP
MYSWGDDTSDWAKPSTYDYDPLSKVLRDDAVEKSKAHGPRAYTTTARAPNEQLTSPKKEIASTSPNPLIIAVDVTGSMQRWPAEIFDRLPLLYQTLSQYRTDLEVSFAAIGDCRYDRWPLQVTSFAKGYALEDNLKGIFGEGGGGDAPESYGVFAWWVQHRAHVTAERPFLIVFGDALMHDTILPGELKQFVGAELVQPASALAAWRAVSRTWSTWFLRRPGGVRGDEIDQQWTQAIGAQNVVHMDDEQRAVDYAMALVARSWGHFDDFKANMTARQDDGKVKGIAERLSSIERAIEAAKAPRVLDCPKCGAALPRSEAREMICDYCNARVVVPLRT